MKNAKSKGGGMDVGILGINNNPKASVMERNNASKKTILAKMLDKTYLEKTENGKEYNDLQ